MVAIIRKHRVFAIARDSTSQPRHRDADDTEVIEPPNDGYVRDEIHRNNHVNESNECDELAEEGGGWISVITSDSTEPAKLHRMTSNSHCNELKAIWEDRKRCVRAAELRERLIARESAHSATVKLTRPTS
jgi:hypothetical protein